MPSWSVGPHGGDSRQGDDPRPPRPESAQAHHAGQRHQGQCAVQSLPEPIRPVPRPGPDLLSRWHRAASGLLGEVQEKLVETRIRVGEVPFYLAESVPHHHDFLPHERQRARSAWHRDGAAGPGRASTYQNPARCTCTGHASPGAAAGLHPKWVNATPRRWLVRTPPFDHLTRGEVGQG